MVCRLLNSWHSSAPSDQYLGNSTDVTITSCAAGSILRMARFAGGFVFKGQVCLGELGRAGTFAEI
jgi:hypothetical protein